MKPVKTSEPEDAAVQPDGQKKHSLGARSAFALAFAFVGAKLSWIGFPMDIKNLLSKTKADTFFGKVKELKQQIKEDVAKDPKVTNWLERKAATVKGYAKVFKYGTILSVAGIAAGAVLGWTRGERAGSPKNIIHHPIQSVKLVLGIDPANPEKPDEPLLAKATPPQPQELRQNPPHWQERVGQPDSEAFMARS